MEEECLRGEEALEFSYHFHDSGLEQVRNWIRKQRFIPHDISDGFIQRFLTATDENVQLAIKMIHKYFYLRQESGPIFRGRNPTLPKNRKLFGSLYVIPIRNLLNNKELILLTGLLHQTTNYSIIGHIKLIALTLDYLIWDKMNNFIDLKILMDGQNFLCPALLDSNSEIEIQARRFQKSLPIKFRGLYIYRPPEHVREIAKVHNGIWITTIETPEEATLLFPSSILPFEFGGSLGHLNELLDDWNLQMSQRVKFLVQFEKRMVNDCRRRKCHEKEVREGGKNWVAKMKLFEVESGYKKRYYEKMANLKPIYHPAFGNQRQKNKPKLETSFDPLRNIRMMLGESD